MVFGSISDVQICKYGRLPTLDELRASRLNAVFAQKEKGIYIRSIQAWAVLKMSGVRPCLGETVMVKKTDSITYGSKPVCN